jgi:hypothetical protein
MTGWPSQRKSGQRRNERRGMYAKRRIKAISRNVFRLSELGKVQASPISLFLHRRLSNRGSGSWLAVGLRSAVRGFAACGLRQKPALVGREARDRAL